MSFRLTIEVPLALAFFGFMLTASVDTNLMIYRTCYVIMGFDKYNCSLLGNRETNISKEIERLVQPKADVIVMVKTVVDSVSAAILCLFVGAWSDRFGRKPVIIMNLIGYTLMNMVMVIFSSLENASPWLMMTCSIPVILTGGGASLLTVLLAYLTDVTSEEERGFRMGLFEVAMGSSVLIGTLVSPYVLNATGYAAVYGLAAVACFLALVYTIFCLPESLAVRETTGRIRGLFQAQNLSGMFSTSFRNRPHFRRPIILLTMLALALFFVSVSGDGSVMFLFMREKFQWTLKQYTWFSSSTNLMWISGTIFIVYVVHYKLHVKEAILVFLGLLSFIFGPLIQALAGVDWLIYIAAVVKMPSGGITPMTRSLLSKLVDVDEAGKIFALFNFIQNILGLVGAPVYTTLYNATINTNPGAFNFLTTSIHMITSTCLLVVLLLQKMTSDDNYRVLQVDNAQQDLQDTPEQSNLLVN